jgi:hypothetical protein
MSHIDSILYALQAGEITCSRAKECLEAVEAGTFTLDWLPKAEAYFGDELPIDVCKRLQRIVDAIYL